jgi:hypothetical protein
MKNIQLDELKKDELLMQVEPISIEHQGKLVGYYYPAIDHEKVKKAKEELDAVMEKVLAETGLTEDEYVAVFQSDEVNKQVNLGREFMSEYPETFQELAK